VSVRGCGGFGVVVQVWEEEEGKRTSLKIKYSGKAAVVLHNSSKDEARARFADIVVLVNNGKISEAKLPANSCAGKFTSKIKSRAKH